MSLSFFDLSLLATVAFLFFKLITKNNDFFEKRGIKHIKPSFLVGNTLGVFTGKENGVTIFQNFGLKFAKEKLFGMFMFTRPVFIVQDVELVKQITIKEFDSFVNHDGNLTNGSDGIFGKSVLLLEDDSWREMRNKLSPIFTSSKIKTMYHHMTACADDLTDFFDEILKKTGKIVIESKNVFARFTAESISLTALGFKGNCIKDEKSEVFKVAQHINDDFLGLGGALKFTFIPMFPKLAKFFDVKIFRQSTHDFFKKFVTEEIKRRETQGITNAKDVIQLLIQAKNNQLKINENENEMSDKLLVAGKHLDWNDDELVAAQVFIFFAGGFETTSTLMQMMSWELAMNQEIQKELIKEVDEVADGLNGNPVPYETLNNMKFLDMVVNETLRKWPPLPSGGRTCNRDCRVTTSDGEVFQFKKGDFVQIPFQAIQHNPKYFENPSKFDPYRFSEENKQKIIPGSFLTFGYGPRICLGARLALLEAKLVFFTMLSKYTIEICEKTPKQVTYSASPVAFKEKVYVELKPRK